MHGQRLYAIAQYGRIIGSEMVQHLLSVGADEIESVVVSAYPLAVGTVCGDATDAHSIEQIVGQPASVIAVYLDLLVVEIIVEELCGVGDDEEPQACTRSYSSVEVFTQTVEFLWDVAGIVLIDDIAA